MAQRASRRWVAALTATAAMLCSCSSDTPDLLTPVTPEKSHDRITNAGGSIFLEEISTHKWPDGGREAASYFDWIPQDARSPDRATSQQAGETAHTLAVFLADHRQALEAVGNGLLGLRKAPVGKANPQLVAAYGAALTPYLPAIAGSDGSPGFPPFQHSTPEDFARARNIFAVIATNTEAGREFVERASEDAERIAATAAHDACEPESAKHNVDSAVLRTAGILAGLADSMSNEGSGPERHQILDDISYTMAAACVSADPMPPTSQIADYMESGRLLTPDEVLQQRDEGLEDYYQSLRDYLATRDIEIEPYLEWYEKARG